MLEMSPKHWLAGFCLGLPLIMACDASTPPAAPARLSASPLPSSTAPSPSTIPPPPSSAMAPLLLPPLQAKASLVPLKIGEGFGDAVVSLPLGARKAMPVVVAAHGNYDRPEWQCEVHRPLFENSAFVLCPRGIARPDSPSADDIRFTYSTNQVMEQEILAGLRALKAAYAPYVEEGAVLHLGFSLGAIMGVPMASRNPGLFPRLVLIEGGHGAWSPENTKRFAEGGGQRVLFVCAQAACEKDAQWAASRLQKAGVSTQIQKGPHVGHRYDGPIAEATKKGLAWVLEKKEKSVDEPGKKE